MKFEVMLSSLAALFGTLYDSHKTICTHVIKEYYGQLDDSHKIYFPDLKAIINNSSIWNS